MFGFLASGSSLNVAFKVAIYLNDIVKFNELNEVRYNNIAYVKLRAQVVNCCLLVYILGSFDAA